MTSAPVTVVLDGRRVDASTAARIVGGVVVGPLVPFVRDLAERVDADRSGRRITIVRGARSFTVTISPPSRDASATDALVPLAAIARALGDRASYDGRARTLELLTVPAPLATETPLGAYAPPTPPLQTFAPKATPAPAVTISGIPRPRRTPIPVEPEH